MLRKIFGPEKDEVNGRLRIASYKGLTRYFIIYRSPISIVMTVKATRLEWRGISMYTHTNAS
jgi:hypothetical protein